MNVLLIWDESPESIEYYLIQNIDNKDLDLLDISSNKYLGMDNSEIVDCSLQKIYSYIDSNSGNPKWLQFKIVLPCNIVNNIGIIFTCGMSF